jgi:D-beta-D-heptose 7-phosphate kinase/D-beta-D-heptose 1-phosphate adenosyltransferase
LDTSASLALIDSFTKQHVCVVGDFYLDEYIYVRATGLSPEMPVPRTVEERTEHTPGAAGNVALNLTALGARVSAHGIIGADSGGEILLRELQTAGVETTHLLRAADRRTGTFTRILEFGPKQGAHHYIRIDKENATGVSPEQSEILLATLATERKAYSAFFLADYDETAERTGLLTRSVLDRLFKLAASTPTLAISRRHGADLLRATYFFCNKAEARGLGLQSAEDLTGWSDRLRRTSDLKTVCVTLGADGCFCSSPDTEIRLPSFATSVVDVCGAGDTFATIFLLAQCAAASLQESALLASYGAAVAVQKPGTQAVSAAELKQAVRSFGRGGQKLMDRDSLSSLLDARRNNATVVFTNGCFDLLHAGHISFLREARALGDLLVVGINSDRSAHANKGQGRPLLSEQDRITILSALGFVDYITVFDELTPINLIRALRPHVLVKGGNYRPDEVVGKDIVEGYGGRVIVVPSSGETTTSTLIRSMQHASDGTLQT